MSVGICCGLFILTAKRLGRVRRLLFLELLVLRHVHHDLDGIHELAQRLVELFVVGVLVFLADAAYRDVDEGCLVVEHQHGGRLDDGNEAANGDGTGLGDGEDLVGGGDLDDFVVDQNLGIVGVLGDVAHVGVDTAYALEQGLPRDAVSEIKGGANPARFFGNADK